MLDIITTRCRCHRQSKVLHKLRRSIYEITDAVVQNRITVHLVCRCCYVQIKIYFFVRASTKPQLKSNENKKVTIGFETPIGALVSGGRALIT